MTDTVRVPQAFLDWFYGLAASPQEAVPTKREAALADLAKLDGETMDLAASPQGEGSSADADTWFTHDGGPNPVPGKTVEGQYPGETRIFHGPSEGVVWGRGVIYRVTEGVKP